MRQAAAGFIVQKRHQPRKGGNASDAFSILQIYFSVSSVVYIRISLSFLLQVISSPIP